MFFSENNAKYVKTCYNNNNCKLIQAVEGYAGSGVAYLSGASFGALKTRKYGFYTIKE